MSKTSKPGTRTTRTAQKAAPRHVETYISVRTGSEIYVGCVCSIGHNHNYEEWRVHTH